jgi:hypothetical protein
MHEFEKKHDAHPGSPAAVIVRTHLLNEKFHDLLEILSQSTQYDLFVAVDESSGPLAVPGYKTLPHTASSAADFGLCANHPRILWHCCDYALYFSAAQIPSYQRYVMIEYDVDLVRRSPEFVDRVVARLGESGAPDFVSAAFHEADAGWCWTEAAARQFPVVYNSSIFAFVAVSAPALEHLLARRRREALDCASVEDIVNCEAFCASALTQDGFACASINDLVAGAVDFSTFHPPMPSLEVSQYLLNQYRIPDPNIEIVHPVYDLCAYLKRQFDKSRYLRQVSGFLAELDRIRATQEWEAELIETYRGICLGSAP